MTHSFLQTIVKEPEFPYKTGYSSKSMFIGSCFTEHIGNLMTDLKYPADVNPFGILYNPLSVANAIEALLANKVFTENDLTEHNGLWHSFSHHGRFSSPRKETTLKSINQRISQSASFIREAGFLFITLGTAWAYRYKESGKVVSNCHKIPAAAFERFRMEVDDVVDDLGKVLKEVVKQNPKIRIIFTVSPIRHWKDGATENQRSKSILLLATEKLIKNLGDESSGYFPSYEIMMDELRDYRFYAEDMLHPSTVAVKYIWGKFQKALIDEESLKISKEIQKVNLALNHKPVNKFTEENRIFLNQTLNKINDLSNRFTVLNFEPERNYILDKINELEEK